MLKPLELKRKNTMDKVMSHHRLQHWYMKKKEEMKAKWVLLPYTPFYREKFTNKPIDKLQFLSL